jgi:hypothetical protein
MTTRVKPAKRRVQDLDIGRMLACRSVDELDAALLELAFRARLAPSIALWREIESGHLEETWLPVRARGPSELQPPESMVRAVLEGAIDERLPGGAVVLSACTGPRCSALVLGGDTWDEEGARIGSALLALHACIAGPAARSADFGSALPRRDDEARDDGDRTRFD